MWGPIWFCIWMQPEPSYLIQKWKKGYGNVCDEPGETWPGLASTFTQKRINLFNHPELLLCIPDEAEWAKLCPLGVACPLYIPKYAWEGGGKSCGDTSTVSWSHASTWTHYRNLGISLPLVFFASSYWSHLKHRIAPSRFISPTKQ